MTVGTCGCIFPEFNQPARRGEVTPHPKKTITIEVTELTEKTGFPDQLSGNYQAGTSTAGGGFTRRIRRILERERTGLFTSGNVSTRQE